MKRLSLVIALIFCAFSFVAAQKTVTGTVADNSGEPLIGASILVKGTTSGTVSDIDGSFSLAVPTSTATLVVSYTGYSTTEVEVDASTSRVAIVLEENAAQLNEVVVTGLGIRRDKKALGYAVTTLGTEELEARPEGDVTRVLRGKVPGVNITQTSGLAGSGTNVIIRGYTSILGSNQPLFVIDGVPFNSNTNADQDFVDGGASASSRFADLDPNTIAEVSVLKGLSATVLYGEAGRNGVILITTKNGLAGDINKKMEVTVDQGIFVSRIASLPEDQDLYGNGFHNEASAAFSNWGAPFDTPGRFGLPADGAIPHPYQRYADVLPEFADARLPYRPYDNLQGFFDDGLIKTTAINIANRLSEGTSVNFSYGLRDEESFVPLSTFTRHNFGLGFQTELGNGLKINSTFNYVNTDRTAPPTSISFSSNPSGDASLFSNVFYVPRSIDLNGMPYENPQTRGSIFYRGGNDIQNPYWTLNNTGDEEAVRRFFGTVNLSYPIASWLSANYRIGIDGYTQRKTFHVNKGGIQLPLGILRTSERSNFIQDHNLNLQYNTRLSDNITLDGVFGLNVRKDNFNRTTATSEQQFVYGLLTHDNFISHLNTSRRIDENLIGAYGTVSLGYRNFAYVNVQARNDWTSTLEQANRAVFYPSVSASFIPTEAFAGLQNNKTINYLKLRLGYGTSAGYPDPYATRSVLGLNTRTFVTNGGEVINTNFVANTLGNPNLQAEIHRELEFGMEGRFFNNRLGIDLSLYDKNSSDLIIALDLDPSTGFTNTTVNAAGLNNKGIELGANLNLIRTKKVDFTINGNFTRNISEVTRIAEGIDQVNIAGFSNIGNFAIVGQPYGIIQGAVIRRAPEEAGPLAGQRLIGSNGVYLEAPDIGVLGDPNAAYILNYGFNLSVHGLTFNALMTYQDGGVMYATTPSTLMGRGILEETGFDRFVPVIAPGARQLTDGTYIPNNVQITSTQHYWQNGGVFNDELRVYDASYIKLREVSVAYSLPKSVIGNSPFGNVTFTLSGQNLWFRALGFPKGANFDPEVASLGVGNGQGFELMNVPTAKQFGGSVRLTF